MPDVDIDIALIKKKSLHGVVALTSRTFLLQVVAFAATFLLTIFLSPAIFGVFYVVSAIISFLGYFSDVGLAAALIQKKETLMREDLVTTFTIQQMLVALLTAAALLLSNKIARFYALDTSGLWLFRALVVSFFLSSLKTIPSVLLERDLEFQKLVIPSIVETIAFYGIAVFLAWRGFGIASFTWAVLVRGIAGLVVMYVISPWRIGFGIRRESARTLLRFGIPFQLNSFLGLVKDDLFTVFLGKILTFSEVGYIGWAKKWADVPLRLFMDAVIRVTFPAYSRLQHDAKVLGTAIEKTLFGLAATILPSTVGLIFFMAPLISLVPKYAKWEPALFSFYLFAVAAVLAGFSTPLTNAFNAVGRIKITLWLMVMWTALTWILGVWFISIFSFSGFSIALVIISLTLVVVVYIVKTIAPIRFWKSIRIPLVAAGVQAGWYAFFVRSAPYVFWRLALVGLSGVILYAGLLWIFDREKIMSLMPKKI